MYQKARLVGIVSLVIIVLSSIGIKAQVLSTNFSNDLLTDKSHALEIFGNGEIGTTTLSTLVLKKYLSNSLLSEDDKGFLKTRKKQNQRFGFESNYGLAFNIIPDTLFRRKNDLTFNFLIENRSIFSALFTNDLLTNILAGNTAYIGDTNGIILSPTSIENYKFQKFGFGVNKKINNDSASTYFFARLSFINAQKYNNLSIAKSTLKFADTTYDVSGNLDFVYEHSKTDNRYFANNGFGGALDLGFAYKFNKFTFLVQANDIGIVKWKSLSVLDIDTAFKYSGYKIDMQRLLNDTLYKFSVDSIFNVASHKSTVSKTTALPYTVRINATTSWLNDKLLSSVDFTFKRVAAFNPRISIIQLYQINTKNRLGVFVSSGGYTKFQYGVVYDSRMNKLHLNLVLMNLHSIFRNSSLPVTAINLQLRYYW